MEKPLSMDYLSYYLSWVSLLVGCVGALGMVIYMLNRMIWRPRLRFEKASCLKLEDGSYSFSVGYHSKGDIVIEDTLTSVPGDVLVIKELGKLALDSPVLPCRKTGAVMGWVQHRTPMYADSRTIIGQQLRFVPRANVTHVSIEVVVRAHFREDRIPWLFDMFPPKTVTVSKSWKFDVEPPSIEYEQKLTQPRGRGATSFPLEISEDEWREILRNHSKEAD